MKRISPTILTLALFAVLASPYATHAQDGAKESKIHLENEDYWNQFRGPNGDGKTLAINLPLEFSETKNVRWKTPIHDKGWSSPVVWGKQIWLTTAREDGTELFAICVDLESGKVIHDIKVFDVAQPQSEYPDLNSHASPTPIVEEGRVYVHFGTYGTACLDTKSGEKLWERRDLNTDHRVRPASSPIIDGDSLFLVFDGVDVQFVVALDKNTGETLWLRNREVKSDFAAVLKAEGVTDVEKVKKEKPNDNRKSYATPTIIEHQGKKQLISPAAEVTISYGLKTGEELWRVRHQGWGWNVACRPIYEHGLVFFTTGVAKNLLAVRPSGIGDVTDTHIVWSSRKGTPEIPSPLIVDDLIFFTNEGGVVSCLEAKSGRQVWQGRIGGNHWASPLYAAGKIYFFSQEGKVSVISAIPEFQLLAENELDASFIASPAVAGDTMILRSTTHLYYIANGFERIVLETERKESSKKRGRGKDSLGGRKNDGKERGEKGGKGGEKASIQDQVKGWTDYFRKASNQQISEAIRSEKFQYQPTEVKRGILAAARKEYEAKRVIDGVVEEVQRSLQK